MRLLKTLTLLLFVLVSVNSFAQSYKVTVKEVRASCERGPPPNICFVGVDNSELTPLCGPVNCSGNNTFTATLSLPSRWTSDEHATLSFPAPGKVEANVNFFDGLRPSAPKFSGSGYRVSVQPDPSAPLGYGSTIKGTFRLPAFDITLPHTAKPNPGECIESYFSVDKYVKRQLRVAANQITEVKGSQGSATIPPGLVHIPNGQIARMKTKSSSPTPLKERQSYWGEVCNTEIQGFIDISYAFRTLAGAKSASWDFSGGLRVSASPTDETLQDYVGTIGVSAMIFSSDVDGALINAEEAGPDTISTTFRYEEDSDPNDNILGWMEIDLSSLSNQQWQSFEMEWLVDGRTFNQEFTSVYAIGLGQLLKNLPGSRPLSMRLPVIEQGGDPMTLTVSGGGHPLTIEYALFGASGSDSPYMPLHTL